MADRIRINGLRIFGHHGVDSAEREKGQHFIVDIEAEVDLMKAGSSDRIEDTLDYGPLIKEVERIVSQEQYALLEGVAERIAQAVLEHPKVLSTTVKVAKPDPPIDADLASVQVEITRPT